MAVRMGSVTPDGWFGVHAVSNAVATAYSRLMQRGRCFPPVVVVDYGDSMMPLDGHHRLTAAKMLGRDHAAVIVDGEWFEDQCIRRKDQGRDPPDAVLIALADRIDRRTPTGAFQ